MRTDQCDSIHGDIAHSRPLPVNYGGSTGYGRLYRQRLRGQWGIVDVADCVGAARWLVTRGQADANRLVIRGRSA